MIDTIPKYVTDIRGAEIIPFKGININGVSAEIQNKSLILDKEFTIFHVGTNDIPHLDKGAILSSFNNLITIVRGYSKTKIVFSSVLPRPVDHESNDEKVKDVNKDLMKLCEQRKIKFLHSYRPFLKFGKPIRELFAIRDHGLHFNLEGLRRLRLFFINTIVHLLRGKEVRRLVPSAHPQSGCNGLTLGESLSLSVLLSHEDASFIPWFGGLEGVGTARPFLALPGCKWYEGVESAVQFFLQ